MRFHSDALRGVFYVGFQLADGKFQFGGTGFLLGISPSSDPKVVKACFMVTAKHVIDKIKATGVDGVWTRFNLSDHKGHVWAKSKYESWFSHPTDATIDVAIRPLPPNPKLDHAVVPWASRVTPDFISDLDIGVGDEVIVLGLFSQHAGKERNRPIARVGNIASMDQGEKVSTRFGPAEGYLIEARSIGGISGSPVFVNITPFRSFPTNHVPKTAPGLALLGLVHGHFDEKDESLSKEGDEASKVAVNMGIALVTPAGKIGEVIDLYVAAVPPAGLLDLEFCE